MLNVSVVAPNIRRILTIPGKDQMFLKESRVILVLEDPARDTGRPGGRFAVNFGDHKGVVTNSFVCSKYRFTVSEDVQVVEVEAASIDPVEPGCRANVVADIVVKVWRPSKIGLEKLKEVASLQDVVQAFRNPVGAAREFQGF